MWRGWASYASDRSQEILYLIPVATNTKYWKDCVFYANQICFLNDTRLKFRIGNGVDAEKNKGISIACVMVYFGMNNDKFNDVFRKYGNIR